ALVLGDLVRGALVSLGPGYPDAPVVPERLAHERELALVLAGHGDARRVDLREAGVREARALLVRAPDRGGVRALRVRREEEHGPVAARAQDNRVAEVRLELPGDHVPGDDAARVPV